MSTTTTNFGLTKPDATDNVDVSVINTNYDLIDTKAALKANSSGGGELGTSASATTGGAIGNGAKELYGGGAAVGQNARSSAGGFAGGWGAQAASAGAAVGSGAYATNGAAIGGGGTCTTSGVAAGLSAKCLDSSNNKIDAIQLGTGTNTSPHSFQVYGYQMMDANGKIPYARMPQDEIEPKHATQTVTGTNGSITISNALDAPLLEFTATGMGTPSAVVIPDAIGAAMGQQDWDHPMILDVPLGVVRDMGDFYLSILSPAFIAYGSGVGSNSYDAASGAETGTTVYINSRNFAKLIEAIEISGAGNVSDDGEIDGNTAYLFEIPLPFSVAENSVVYCSHFKNQNISGEEGIWASGSTLYIRSSAGHLDDDFGKLSDQMVELSGKINYYSPMGLKGFATENFCDFFVCLTAATSYTMERDPVAVKTFNGTYTYDWFKISDYLQLFFGDGEELPTLTSLTSISATYYTDIAVNRNLVTTLNAVIIDKFNTATVGNGAFASHGGGAVGSSARAINGGGAVGQEATANGGGAVGSESYTDYGGGAVGSSARAINGGGAVGQEATANGGGAVGQGATANGGGAVGDGAKTTNGCAIGSYAQCVDSNHDPIDAVQLGTGTNSTVKSMQVYGTQLLYYHSNDNTHYIPLSLITASYGAASADDRAAFKAALGIS